MIEGIWPQNHLGSSTFLGNDALDWPILVSVFYTEVLTNVYHCVLWHCGCVLAMSLILNYIRYRNVTKLPTVVMVLYESKMLLVSFIWFCPTDERTLVLASNKGEPEFLLQITFLFIPLVVCRSEIITSESIIQHACIMFSYLHRIFIFTSRILPL